MRLRLALLFAVCFAWVSPSAMADAQSEAEAQRIFEFLLGTWEKQSCVRQNDTTHCFTHLMTYSETEHPMGLALQVHLVRAEGNEVFRYGTMTFDNITGRMELEDHVLIPQADAPAIVRSVRSSYLIENAGTTLHQINDETTTVQRTRVIELDFERDTVVYSTYSGNTGALMGEDVTRRIHTTETELTNNAH